MHQLEITDALKKVVDGVSLTAVEAEAVLDLIIAGESTEAQIAALLTALRMKGETVDELTGFARAMRKRALKVRANLPDTIDADNEPLLDTCGTGGDFSGSFNISTVAAFVVAGAGVRVAKHGNRSATSRCGSADVIEALGVKIEIHPEQIAACIDTVGIGFLHAPHMHSATKHVAAVRKQIGIRTIFNALGPLTNPAGANAQLIGVYAEHLTETVASVLCNLGVRRALVVHGLDGMDEVTITTRTKVTELFQGEIRTYHVSPEQYDIPLARPDEIRGGGLEENTALILGILDGEAGPRRDIVLLNSAAALMAASRASDLAEGLQMAKHSIDTGAALSKLKKLIEFTNSL